MPLPALFLELLLMPLALPVRLLPRCLQLPLQSLAFSAVGILTAKHASCEKQPGHRPGPYP